MVALDNYLERDVTRETISRPRSYKRRESGSLPCFLAAGYWRARVSTPEREPSPVGDRTESETGQRPRAKPGAG
jgi:hypothetical protein